jgi:dihydrofolate reductase
LNTASKQQQQQHVYVIGGGKLYHTALSHPRTKSILLTELEHRHGSDVDCNTFFDGFSWYARNQPVPENGAWIRQSHEKLREFVGPEIDISKVHQLENGFSFEFTLLTRE